MVDPSRGTAGTKSLPPPQETGQWFPAPRNVDLHCPGTVGTSDCTSWLVIVTARRVLANTVTP